MSKARWPKSIENASYNIFEYLLLLYSFFIFILYSYFICFKNPTVGAFFYFFSENGTLILLFECTEFFEWYRELVRELVREFVRELIREFVLEPVFVFKKPYFVFV